VTDAPALLLAGFEVWPGPSPWGRRVSEAVRAARGRHRVITLSIREGDLPYTGAVDGARVLRVPLGTGTLLDRLEAFARAVQRQLDGDVHALVHTADPVVGAAVLGHPGRAPLLYEAGRLSSVELPWFRGTGGIDASVEATLQQCERSCLRRARAVVVATRARAQEVRAMGRRLAVHHVPQGIEPVRGQQSAERAPGGPLRIRHVGWQLTPSAVTYLARVGRRLGPGYRLELVQPAGTHWGREIRREVAGALAGGHLHPPIDGARPASPDVDLLGGFGAEAAAPATLAEALPALAEGRPVVAVDSDVARAELPAGCTLFCPPGDAEALAAALGTLGADAALRAGAGAQALAYVEREHHPAQVRGLLRDLYRHLGTSRSMDGLRLSSLPTLGTPSRSDVSGAERAWEPTDPGTPSGGFG
jgi:hypothetical protein